MKTRLSTQMLLEWMSFIAQVPDGREKRVNKKLSQEFNSTENQIIGGLLILHGLF